MWLYEEPLWFFDVFCPAIRRKHDHHVYTCLYKTLHTFLFHAAEIIGGVVGGVFGGIGVVIAAVVVVVAVVVRKVG